jgi:NAD(P)-dependent dehydrogenase (short-subunit alcohol dehydrogenase family)
MTRTLRAGAVVVTGASSGIGRACALALADSGYTVFAVVRKRPDGDALTASSGGALHPVLMDITVQDEVHAAAGEIAWTVGGAGLAGLVNSAGIGVTGPMECIPSEQLRHQYEVNVFGQVTVIQAFLPLLRRGRGRLVNIGSIGDRMAVPFAGPLTSSKAALASITDALRLELRPWGVGVVLVEPASIHTEAVGKLENDAERVLDQLDERSRARYAAGYRSMVRSMAARERAGSEPDVVAKAVCHALTTRRPRPRYRVGRDARRLALVARWMPERLLDTIRLRLFGLPTGFGFAAESPSPDVSGGSTRASGAARSRTSASTEGVTWRT